MVRIVDGSLRIVTFSAADIGRRHTRPENSCKTKGCRAVALVVSRAGPGSSLG
jgi:hypothetical protein